jgi:hypothetical protein
VLLQHHQQISPTSDTVDIMGWVQNATPEVEAISQWPMIIPVIAVMTVLSTVVVSLRLWIRHKARGLALDDHFSALSMVFAIIYSALSIARGCLFLVCRTT